MFTFRITTLTFFILLLFLNIMGLAGYGIHFGYYLALIGVYITISVILSFFIQSGFHMKALCKGVTSEKIVSITFDDGPDIEYTHKILDVMKEAGITATFFCIGRKIEGNEELIKRMDQEGHLIGTHSYSHSNWFDLFSSRRMKREFNLSEEKIKQIIGKRPLLFRPPYGVINPMVKRALRGTGYHVIGFSNRALDTVVKKEAKILSRIIRSLKPGDIVLLHDTIQQNINVLKSFLEWSKQNGYRVLPLDQLLKIVPYE
jgi:peptidoglycan-N-acetylglucosamine deacetylase